MRGSYSQNLVVDCEPPREEHRLFATPTDKLFSDSFLQIVDIMN